MPRGKRCGGCPKKLGLIAIPGGWRACSTCHGTGYLEPVKGATSSSTAPTVEKQKPATDTTSILPTNIGGVDEKPEKRSWRDYFTG
jgi:mono/diheme cytochrome c family protein